MRHLALLLVIGCGSSAKSSTTPKEPAETPEQRAEREAREAREVRRKEIDAMKPADPYELRDKTAYASKDRCGQGPYRFESEALKARYGERVVVYACGKAIRGNYRMTTTRRYGTPSTDESAFGHATPDNAACKGTPVAVAAPGTSTASGGGRGGSSGGGPTAAAPTKLDAHVLTKAEVPADCKKTSVTSYGWSSAGAVALDGTLTFDIWSDVPNDLEGLVFVVERLAIPADMTPERWKNYERDYDLWYDAYRKFSDEQLAAGEWTLVDTSVKTPPPPAPRAETPPPKPSANARWIPGYWHYAEAKFHWIAGLWDVPEEDVKKELTVQAPSPPPVRAPRDVPPEPRPTTAAVWTPGSWYWDGRAYIWIAGAWRIPPGANQTWQAPSWSVRTGRAIYVPGGWRIRIGR